MTDLGCRARDTMMMTFTLLGYRSVEMAITHIWVSDDLILSRVVMMLTLGRIPMALGRRAMMMLTAFGFRRLVATIVIVTTHG
jgi:hypothetical protein